MKEVMSTCPILALPDFTHPFVLECDASGEGIGVVLMQQRNQIAYKSRKLSKREKIYPIYVKEILAIIHSLEKIRQYLVGGKFMVKTYHNNLRHLLGQKVIQVDIGGHPPFPNGSKQFSGHFGNLLFLAGFHFRGHFEGLNEVFSRSRFSMIAEGIIEPPK
jgi:hypothetical protein